MEKLSYLYQRRSYEEEEARMFSMFPINVQHEILKDIASRNGLDNKFKDDLDILQEQAKKKEREREEKNFRTYASRKPPNERFNKMKERLAKKIDDKKGVSTTTLKVDGVGDLEIPDNINIVKALGFEKVSSK